MIDIKELRAGCHLLLNNRRVKVANIDSLNNLIGIEEYYYVAKDGIKYCIANEPKDLDPIPITEELLKELGFEEEKPQGEGWDYGIEKVFMKEFINDDGELDFVSLAQYEGGLYQIQVLGTIAYVRDLHTLQNFVYLTTKQELI